MWENTSSGVSAEFRRLRPIIWRRDSGLCHWPLYSGSCGHPGHAVDHIIARSNGGEDIESNLRVLCTRHHNRKTADEAAAGRRRARR